jgi:prophage regulatory protein
MSDMSSHPASAGVLRLPEVRRLTGLGRSTIYRRIGDGRFPQQLDLEGGLVGWSRAEIEEWLANRPRRSAPS